MEDERFYEAVSEEIKLGIYKEGLRAKAFSEANGAEPKAQALYIKYRVSQLIAEDKQERKSREQEAAGQRKRDWAAKQAAEAENAKDKNAGALPLILFWLAACIAAATAIKQFIH